VSESSTVKQYKSSTISRIRDLVQAGRQNRLCGTFPRLFLRKCLPNLGRQRMYTILASRFETE
jgi:hypothetical protein